MKDKLNLVILLFIIIMMALTACSATKYGHERKWNDPTKPKNAKKVHKAQQYHLQQF